MLKKLFSSLSLVMTLAIFSLVLIMGGEDRQSTPAIERKSDLHAVGLYSSGELTALARHFGSSVPYLHLSGSGMVQDTSYPGGYARTLTFKDHSGLSVTAVRPAAAAQLLNPGGLSFDASQVYAINDMTAILADDETGCYLFFSSADAAYCLHMNVTPSEMTALPAQLHFTD